MKWYRRMQAEGLRMKRQNGRDEDLFNQEVDE
jgi:hypothetical protein